MSAAPISNARMGAGEGAAGAQRTAEVLAEAPTVIDSGATFEGLLTFRGAARVDGHLVGRVVADGCLVIGPRGRIEAEVEVDELVVAGEFQGEARVHQRVELLSSGKVRGTLHAPSFALAEGCQFDGRWHTTDGSRGGSPAEGVAPEAPDDPDAPAGPGGAPPESA